MDSEYKIVEELEVKISSKSVRSNPLALLELIHDEFEEFGKSGKIFKKKDIVSELPKWPHTEIHLSDIRFTRLSNEAILIKYLCVSNDKKTNRSSIWVKESESWQIIFHQGTLC